MNDPRSLSNYYDLLAPVYDSAAMSVKWQPNDVLTTAISQLKIQPQSILDLGSGTGMTLGMLKLLFPNVGLESVEMSARMIEMMRRKPELAEVRWHQSEILAFLEQTNYSWDLITIIGVCEFIEGIESLIKLIGMHLNPGGVVALTYQPTFEAVTDQIAVSINASDQFGGQSFSSWQRHPEYVGRLLGKMGEIVHREQMTAFYHENDEPVIYELIITSRVG